MSKVLSQSFSAAELQSNSYQSNIKEDAAIDEYVSERVFR